MADPALGPLTLAERCLIARLRQRGMAPPTVEELAVVAAGRQLGPGPKLLVLSYLSGVPKVLHVVHSLVADRLDRAPVAAYTDRQSQIPSSAPPDALLVEVEREPEGGAPDSGRDRAEREG